jgi:hypothetical protein
MNLQNYVDVAGLKAKVNALHEDHNARVNTHDKDKQIPEGHASRKLSHETIRVMVAEAVNVASKDIIAAAKDEVFSLVHQD